MNSREMHRLLILLLIGFLFSITQASAYIGPATITMIWQVMLASFLAAGYLVHVYWDRIKFAVKNRFEKPKEEST